MTGDLSPSERNELPTAVRWATPVGSVVLALLGNLLVPNGIFEAPFYITAVMISGQVGGTGPGLLAFALASAFLDYFHIPPTHTFAIRPDIFPSLAQFVSPCVLGLWFVARRKEVERLLARETAFAKCLQGSQSLEEIGRSVLAYLAPELAAPVAALYTVESDGTARRRAGYAFDLATAPETIARGQGVLAQVAADMRPFSLSVPSDYLTVRSSLGAKRPTLVVVVPAHEDGQTHAIVELGLFRQLDRGALRFLERIAEPLAIAVRSAAYRTRLQELFEETRQQAEELRVHEEELRAANDGLQQNARAMLEAQRKLEGQQTELEQTNQTLQEQARVVEQQNEELGRAQEAVRLKSDTAERANRTKSEFLANMSHELRTPLNSALILSKLLTENRDGNLTAEQIRFAETIYGAGNDLLKMIDEILDLAKIEAGKLDLRVAPMSIAPFLEDLERTFRPVAAERGLRFETRIADGVSAMLSTDAQRLGQILKNLLSNAFKFTDQGQVLLSVAQDAEHWSFAVEDSGVGIPEGQLDLIFEAFRQADGGSNRGYGGTGLGLSISRDLARLLGGTIQVSSVLGQGSTFVLRLPSVQGAPLARKVEEASRAPAPAAIPALPEPKVAEPTAAREDGRTILIVEDDARFADIVVGLARELHFRATIAANADDAFRSATEQPPKGIVLDMKLPDHSGLSLLDRLKRDPRTRHIPVHVISVSDHTREALEMGAVGYMLKPVEREQITAALRKLESQFTRSIRRLLVVEDDLVQREAICQLLGGENVEIVAVGTVKEALEQLHLGSLDCVVTDLTLPDATGFDLLETMALDGAYSFPSVVVYTGRSLSADDEQRLRKYSSSIIVKGARSPERLLDEVTLFLHQVESTLPPERQRMLRRARHREAVFEGRSVLLVEDDVRNVFALTTALEPKGMTVSIARNGREALEALERDPGIDIVLMDIMMPEMDGLEATRAIRRQPKWANLPIIALTAKAMVDDQEHCLKAGANDYVPKPLDVEMLLSLLRVWLAR